MNFKLPSNNKLKKPYLTLLTAVYEKGIDYEDANDTGIFNLFNIEELISIIMVDMGLTQSTIKNKIKSLHRIGFLKSVGITINGSYWLVVIKDADGMPMDWSDIEDTYRRTIDSRFVE